MADAHWDRIYSRRVYSNNELEGMSTIKMLDLLLEEVKKELLHDDRNTRTEYLYWIGD